MKHCCVPLVFHETAATTLILTWRTVHKLPGSDGCGQCVVHALPHCGRLCMRSARLPGQAAQVAESYIELAFSGFSTFLAPCPALAFVVPFRTSFVSLPAALSASTVSCPVDSRAPNHLHDSGEGGLGTARSWHSIKPRAWWVLLGYALAPSWIHDRPAGIVGAAAATSGDRAAGDGAAVVGSGGAPGCSAGMGADPAARSPGAGGTHGTGAGMMRGRMETAIGVAVPRRRRVPPSSRLATLPGLPTTWSCCW